MTITSLTFAFVQYGSTADMARTRTPTSPAPVAETAPAPAPVSDARSCEHRSSCDGPQHSPLYRALTSALSSMVQSARPSAPSSGPEKTTPVAPQAASAVAAAGAASTASTTAATDAADAAAAATPATETATETAAAAPVNVEEAVMNFARALMQVLRGTAPREGRDDGEGRRMHGHRHHRDHGHEHQDWGRRSWGDPAQRIEQIGAQIGAPTPVRAPVAVTGTPATPVSTPVATPTATPATAPADLAPVVASAAAPQPPSASTTMLYIQINMSEAAPKASSFSRATEGLVQAFGTLQQALGLPAADSPGSLQAQLGAFLQTLAEKLRGSDSNSLANMQPGAMLKVSA